MCNICTYFYAYTCTYKHTHTHIHTYAHTRARSLRPETRMEATNKTDRWTKREDKRLTKLVRKFRKRGWIFISEYMEGRTGAMCYERWHKYIKPGINRTTWTATEDSILIEAYDRFGDKWVQLRRSCPGARM